ncbi:hypothetical protein [Spiroplasma tabanidicola]|uniref:Uncharacterized protein n=1 Tax=Spiroplasma tabanidicola TaxID=324079 RepID=A0A6I6CBF0_9MOLU|nr:hypothetical protein [Spiroplasma tabanidicola]QGS51508.1 hypothetical protein STABA_v1c01410 [Spiroplasma tabanidicola]
MKYLLSILSSLSISTTVVGATTISLLQTNTSNKDKNNNNIENQNSDDQNKEKEEPKPEPKKLDLNEVIKINKVDNLKIIYDKSVEDLLLTAIAALNPSLQMDQVEIHDLNTDIGSASVVAKDDSKLYSGYADISFSVYKYNKVNFVLEKDNVELAPSGPTQQQLIKVTNYSIDNWDNLNYPEVFGYDKTYLTVSFDNKAGTIVLKAVGNYKKPPVSDLIVTVKSNDLRPDNEKIIKVKLKVEKVDFELDKNDIKLNIMDQTEQVINVKNYDQLIDDVNRPNKIQINSKDVEARFSDDHRKIYIKSTGVYGENAEVKVSSPWHVEVIKVTLYYNSINAQYDRKTLEMLVNSTEYVNITNFDTLKIEKNMPYRIQSSNEKAITAYLDRVNKRIVINSHDLVDENVVLTIRSDNLNNYPDYIYVKVKAKDAPFKLDRKNVSMKVYETTSIKITNPDEVRDSPRNIPSKFIYTKDYAKIWYDKENRQIQIQAFDKTVTNLTVTISSEMGYSMSISLTIIIPQVKFKLEKPKDMYVGQTQEVNVTNFYELVHENNYPVRFEYSKQGVIEASFNSSSKKVVIRSISQNVFCRNFSLTVISKDGKYRETYQFDVIKQFSLSSLNTNLGNLSDRNTTNIANTLYNLNYNIGLDKEVFQSLSIGDNTYTRATLYNNSYLSKKWFTGDSIYVYYSVPLKDSPNFNSGWTPEAVSNKNKVETKISNTYYKDFDIPLDKLRRDFKEVKLTFYTKYEWSKEYIGTGSFGNNIEHHSEETIAVNYNVNYNHSAQAFKNGVSDFQSGNTWIEIRADFYAAVRFENYNSNARMVVDLTITNYAYRTNPGFWSTYECGVHAYMVLNDFEFIK